MNQKNILFLLCFTLVTPNLRANFFDWAAQAPLASTQNACIYGATVFGTFAAGNQIFYANKDATGTPITQLQKAPISVGVAALATVLNFGALYTFPSSIAHFIVPALNALQWMRLRYGPGPMDYGIVVNPRCFLGLIPPALGLAAVAYFGSHHSSFNV